MNWFPIATAIKYAGVVVYGQTRHGHNFLTEWLPELGKWRPCGTSQPIFWSRL